MEVLESPTQNIHSSKHPEANSLPSSLIYGTEHMQTVKANLGEIVGQLTLEIQPVAEDISEPIEL